MKTTSRMLQVLLVLCALMVTMACNRPVAITSAPAVSYDLAVKLDQVQKLAQSLNTSSPQVLPDEGYASTLVVLKEANQYGKQFNAALTVYFAATSNEERLTAETKAWAALDAITLLLPKVFTPLGDRDAREKLSGVIGETQKFILFLRANALRSSGNRLPR